MAPASAVLTPPATETPVNRSTTPVEELGNTPPAPPEPAILTFFVVAQAVAEQASCSIDEASDMLKFVARAAKWTLGRGTWRVRWWHENIHTTLIRVFPDDTVTEPYTAGALVERYLGVRVRHTKRGRNKCILKLTLRRL